MDPSSVTPSSRRAAQIRPCPGCRLVAEPAEGPTHDYIGASPGCWAAFNLLLTMGPGAGASGQLVVDTYAVQHPGVPERRAIQSLCVHLISICAALERGWPPARAPDLLRRALALSPAPWRWLDPPLPAGTTTVADVLALDDPVVRGGRTVAWAGEVWAAYERHHALVRSWVDQLLDP